MNLFRLKDGNSTNRKSSERGLLLVALVLACFALSPTAQAVVPAPDGGYPGENTAEGDNALLSLTTGEDNTAIGFNALASNTTGRGNTATGHFALHFNTGDNNTATGDGALVSNNSGTNNTATGFAALGGNTTGKNNTATGFGALAGFFGVFNTGDNNTATGGFALQFNTAGTDNTANGVRALQGNLTGFNNTATGVNALLSNKNGSSNTANGVNALKDNTGIGNTATGVNALLSNTTGMANTAIGVSALTFNTTGGSNIALGQSAGINLTTGSNNIEIGNPGVAGDSGKIRIGTVTHQNTFIAGIYGVTVAKGVGVVVDPNGQLGTKGSSERLKADIRPMEKASEAIHALKPVTFRYKKEIDPDALPQFGLVAEEVEKVSPDLVARDAEGKVYTVRYEAVNAMLLNEFLKEHRKVEQQEATITQLKKDFQATVAQLTARLKEQDSKIEKVSAQVEMSKPAPQIVLNDQ
jgi:trimeric autotransporter adhesin